MKLPAWIAALLTALLPACDMVNLPAIKPGITTQAEVRSRMGEPGFIHRNDDGTVTWEYSRQPAGVHCYMIRFDRQEIVTALDQVLTPATYARVTPGLTQDEVRRLLGQPASRQTFDNLGESVWEWRIEGDFRTEETFFSVHFDLADGTVRKAGQRIQQKP
ncbi:MAG: outer membrane protein assembly factor BamE [Dechloromonas sp.]|nr:outer membrane protein assembly factor BamE [Dechloromonas sp.]